MTTTEISAKQKRLNDLRKLNSAGMLQLPADKADIDELASLEAELGKDAPSNEGWLSTPINEEKFKQGWGASYTPPPSPAILKARCTGISVPKDNKGQANTSARTLMFENIEGDPVTFRGGYFIDKITGSGEDSRAGKFKDALDAMNVPYKVQNGILQYKDPKGALCKVDWQWVDLPARGSAPAKKELRIQAILPLDDKTEQAV